MSQRYPVIYRKFRYFKSLYHLSIDLDQLLYAFFKTGKLCLIRKIKNFLASKSYLKSVLFLLHPY